MKASHLLICGAVLLILIVAVCLMMKEKFTQNMSQSIVPGFITLSATPNIPIAPINLSSAPTPIQNIHNQQSTMSEGLGPALASPSALSSLTASIRNNEEQNGLSAFDYTTGDYMGNWVVGSKNDNSITWKFNMVNSTSNQPKCSSVTIDLPDPSTANVFWTLFPNHSTGVPALRKLVPPGILTRWLNGNWMTDTASTIADVPC